jgi:hypothetical protein
LSRDKNTKKNKTNGKNRRLVQFFDTLSRQADISPSLAGDAYPLHRIDAFGAYAFSAQNAA